MYDNFNSNDTNILQKKLMELQGELSMLDNDYETLKSENVHMRDQNDRIKQQNKKIFEKITNYQEGLNVQQQSINSIGDPNLSQVQNSIQEQNSVLGPQASLMESFGPSAAELSKSLASGGPAGESNIGEIHSLYQDLFLTDIKQEVEKAQTDLKSCKQEQNTA